MKPTFDEVLFINVRTGIASLLLYPEDESGDSTQPEDEDSEAGETDEQDGETEPPLPDGEPLERRAAPPARPNLAPHSMQWAIRYVLINPESVLILTILLPTIFSLFLK